ncbi:MAG: hypothetical protein MUF00_17320 [Gemmatimonadaceae bacterium]|jgi:hypothetical protein|nr:hypothetical protein [Gemmatimonadaceae bacterium]
MGPLVREHAGVETVTRLGGRLHRIESDGIRRFVTPDGRGEFSVDSSGALLLRETMRDDSTTVDTRHEYASLRDGTWFRTKSTTSVQRAGRRNTQSIEVQVTQVEVIR